MTFEQYLKEQGVTLRPWQAEAAQALLEAVYGQREGATGKSFLLEILSDFLDEHGNCFELSVAASVDPIRAFVAGCLVEAPEGAAIKQDIFEAYVPYCRRLGLVPASEPFFSACLRSLLDGKARLGKRPSNDGTGRRLNAYVGVRLLA